MKMGEAQADILKTLAHIQRNASGDIKARRGCTCINELIVSLAKTVRHCLKCELFYRGEKCIEPDRLISSFLLKNDGLFQRWNAAWNELDRLSPPDASTLDALQFAMLAFEKSISAIRENLGEQHEWPHLDPFIVYCIFEDCKSDKGRQRLDEEIEDQLWAIGEIAYRLSVAEYRIWYEHREWKSIYQSDRENSFDIRRDFDLHYLALKDFDERHHDAFRLLQYAIGDLKAMQENLPIAFVWGESASSVHPFAEVVKDVLTMPKTIKYADSLRDTPYDKGCMTYVTPSPFLAEGRRIFVDQLYAVFQQRALQAKNSTVRRKWYEAAASLLARFSQGQPAFTEAEAERVIALADAAQRESWIQRQMNAQGGAALEPVPTVIENVPRQIVARFDEDAQKKLVELLEKLGERRGRKPGKKSGAAKKGRRGSMLHGTRTEKMDSQMSDFRTYLADRNHPITKARTISYWAMNLWNEKKKDYAAAAKGKGEKRGYADYKELASAYRSWFNRQVSKRKKTVRE